MHDVHVKRRPARAAAIVTVASFAGTILYRRLASRARKEAELHFEDGSRVTLPEAASNGARLIAVAEDVLAAARKREP